MKRWQIPAVRWGFGAIMLLCGNFNGQAQPSANQEQYLLNPVVLSPSLFNRITSFGGLYTFRTDRSGFRGRPSLHFLDISGIPKQNMLLDMQLQYIHANLFRSLYFTLGYAYQIQLGPDKFLTLSVNGVLTNEVLDLTDALVDDPNDPLFGNQQRISQTHLNIGAGLALRISRFAACLTSPMLLNNLSGPEAASGVPELGLQRNFLIYLENDFRLNREGGFLKPSLLLRQIQEGPMVIDVAMQGGVNGKYWASFLYRTSNMLGLSVGVGFWQRVLLNYCYEFYIGSSAGAVGGNHEITLAFRIQETPPVPELQDYFSTSPK
ncbi:MAG: PorP/SprF family type IX secretion system membrane protein [bacterium]